MRSIDAVTFKQAERILDCEKSTVRRYVLSGRLALEGGRDEHRRLDRGEVEALAAEIYPWRRHLSDPSSYWVVGERAAVILGVSGSRVRELAEGHLLPFVWHRDGVRLFQRDELEEGARSPDALRH